MLNDKIDIKLIDLRLQKILRDFGTSLTLGNKRIVYKINAKVQNRTVDQINDGDPYIVDCEDTFFPQHLTRVSKEYNQDDIWKCTIEFAGTNQMITIYSKELEIEKIYDAIVQFKIDYEEEKQANATVKIK